MAALAVPACAIIVEGVEHLIIVPTLQGCLGAEYPNDVLDNALKLGGLVRFSEVTHGYGSHTPLGYGHSGSKLCWHRLKGVALAAAG